MTTERTANTSLYIPTKTKDRLRLFAARKKVHITTCINEAIEVYLDSKK